MGNCSTKSSVNNHPYDGSPDELGVSQRETMASWYRKGVAATDVYEIMGELGRGTIGEVYHVRKKVAGNLTSTSSVSLADSAESSGTSSDQLQKLEGVPQSGILRTTSRSGPKPIIKTSSYGDLSRISPIDGDMNTSAPAAGHIKDLMTGKVGYLEENDEEVEVETIALAAKESIIKSKQKKADVLRRSNHAQFSDGDQGAEKSPGKKWVPRRRVYFNRHYACKTIATDKIKKSDMGELMNEIFMMRKIDHPYIIRLYEVYEQNQKLWLIMDLCKGGDLSSRKRLPEERACKIVEQILRGAAYLHRRGICHRDIKLENILYENERSDSEIRLIDFGVSSTYDSTIPKQTKKMGAAYTLSPEVLTKKAHYSEKSDVWSIGVIAWILLSGDYPFIKKYEDLKVESRKNDLANARYDFGITWKGRRITLEAKKFVAGCLKRDPEDRWSAIEALAFLQDTWLVAVEEKRRKEIEDLKRIYPGESFPIGNVISKRKDENLLDSHMVEDLKRFSNYGLLRKTILVCMANTMDYLDVGSLQELFLNIDTNHSGSITLPELKNVFKTLREIEESEVEALFAGIDYDKSGHVHYNEFLAALSESHGLITTDRLAATFQRFDESGKGYFDRNDIQRMMGRDHSDEVVESMMKEWDLSSDSVIHFEQFMQYMTENPQSELEVTEAGNDPQES